MGEDQDRRSKGQTFKPIEPVAQTGEQEEAKSKSSQPILSSDPMGRCLVWRTYLELCVIRHHTLETNTNTLDNTQEDGTHNSRVTGSLDTTTDSKGTTSEETGSNGVPGILLYTG